MRRELETLSDEARQDLGRPIGLWTWRLKIEARNGEGRDRAMPYIKGQHGTMLCQLNLEQYHVVDAVMQFW